MSPLQSNVSASAFPSQSFHHLDELWLQVAGTVCNLACTHCFVSSSPTNRNHGFMERAAVARLVREAAGMGVREVYFTGGEPFLHPGLLDILGDTIGVAPCTVLTNGTLFTARGLERLRALSEASRHSLEVRVSLDGHDAAAHDAFRGAGAFARTLAGLVECERHGLLPIVTVTQTTAEDPLRFRDRFARVLRGAGLDRPRIKMLPLFRLGREVGRSGDPDADASLAGLPQGLVDAAHLQCGQSRLVSDRGVYVCPLLVEEPGGRMGDRLTDALRPFELRHGACHTCFATGMTCANA